MELSDYEWFVPELRFDYDFVPDLALRHLGNRWDQLQNMISTKVFLSSWKSFFWRQRWCALENVVQFKQNYAHPCLKNYILMLLRQDYYVNFWTKTVLPNFFNFSSWNFLPINYLIGLFDCSLVLTRFPKKQTVAKALNQSVLGNFAWSNRVFAFSTVVLLAVSPNPFCSGVSGTVNSCCLVLLSIKNRLKFSHVNSLPISDLRKIGNPCSAMNSWNPSGASLFARKHFTTYNLLNSVTITSRFLYPSTLGGFKCPNMSKNTFSRGFVLLTSVFLRTDTFVILHKASVS